LQSSAVPNDFHSNKGIGIDSGIFRSYSRTFAALDVKRVNHSSKRVVTNPKGKNRQQIAQVVSHFQASNVHMKQHVKP
jgi:hypothetical protein